MSLLSKIGLLARIRKSRETRARLVESNLAKAIAYQIRATREAQGMTQAEMAEAAGMSQNNISRLENPDYGKHTSSSLKRIADALDVAVIVRLVPFSQYIQWLSGEPYLDLGLRPDALAVPNFNAEESAERFGMDIKYWPVMTGSPAKNVAANTGTMTGAITKTPGAYKGYSFAIEGGYAESLETRKAG